MSEKLEPWERDYSGLTADELRHHLRNRDRSAWHSTRFWVVAAEKAMQGNWGDLRSRVEMARMGPGVITNGETEHEFGPSPAHDLPRP